MMNRFSIFNFQFLIFNSVYSPTALVLLLSIFSNTAFSEERILLRGATVHTVSGETLSPGEVLIEGAKILEVGATVNSAGAKVIPLDGQHLYPGLIALNTTLGLTEISGVRSTRDFSEIGSYTPDVESWIAVSPDSELIPVARANGITHIQPVPQGGIVSGQSGLVALDGWTMEKMVAKKPTGLHVFWPSMSLDTRPKEKFDDKSKWKSTEEQAKERKARLQELDDFFAEARAYAKAISNAKKESEHEKVPAWEAMVPYVRGEVPVFIHADDLRQIKAALPWAKTNQLKAILVGGRDAWMMAKEIAEQKVPVIYEHIYNLPDRDADRYDVNYRAPEILRAAGVKLALGMGATAFDAGLIKNLPYTVAQGIAFGLPEADALKSITSIAAELVGLNDRLGSIEAGKEATLFVADGNIFDIRSNVKHVWIAGKEVSLETRHTRLYEKYKNRPKAK